MATTKIEHPSVAERKARGKELRERVPHAEHSGWQPASDRPDPVALLEEQNATREQDLVPVRHGRMMATPFTFYRGAAKIMAADLKDTPRAGLTVQLCGDAHLSNFGVFGSPERTLLFDVNDFDETLPGPFEYDVERLAASFTIAARNNGFSEADTQAVTLGSVRAYREAILGFAEMGKMDIWYARLSEGDLLSAIKKLGDGSASKSKKAAVKKAEKRAQAIAAKAKKRDSLHALSKLAEVVDGSYRIKAQPPIVVPLRDLAATAAMSEDEIRHVIHEQFRAYRSTLQSDRRHLLEQFQVIDVARKVVGVGSVGTRAFIVLLQGRDERDPLFLQVKEAQRSVLEDHLPKSRFRQPGERVVAGQRMMQAASDIYLGLDEGGGAGPPPVLATAPRHEGLDRRGVDGPRPASRSSPTRAGGRWRGRMPGRATRSRWLPTSGRTTGSTGRSRTSPRRYADRNEEDFQAFVGAVRSGGWKRSRTSDRRGWPRSMCSRR